MHVVENAGNRPESVHRNFECANYTGEDEGQMYGTLATFSADRLS